MNDVRFAFRQLLRNPGFTAVAVLTLALGIGANTSMFSMLNVAMFPHMPYPDSGRLVRVYRTSPQSQTWSHSCANFLNHREQNHVTCCLVAVFAFGTAPAWLAARVDVNQRLKENVRGATSSRSQRRFQHFLIIGEVALALMLLAGTGTTIRLLQRFARLDPGWNVDDLLTAEVSVPRSKYPSGERRNAFFGQLEERAAALPGVQSASIAGDLPILSFWNSQPLRIGDRPAPPRGEVPVASCYFPARRAANFDPLEALRYE